MKFAIANLFLTALSLPLTHAALLRQGNFEERRAGQNDGQNNGQNNGQNLGQLLKKMKADLGEGKPFDMNEFKVMKQMVKESLNIDPKKKELRDVALKAFERNKGKNVTQKELVFEVVTEIQNQELKDEIMIDVEHGYSDADELSIIDPQAGEDDELDESDGNDSERLLGVPSTTSIWPNGIMKYWVVLEADLSGYVMWALRVLPAMVILEETTNLSFELQGVKMTYADAKYDGTVYLRATSSGCSANIGAPATSGRHGINIGPHCSSGNIQHELLHAAGFHHQQVGSYRDKYVSVYYDNIKAGYSGNFQKLGSSHGLEFVYDYGSIMHYGEYGFSNNGQKTIDCRGHKCGQRDGLSIWDIWELMYYNMGLYYVNTNL